MKTIPKHLQYSVDFQHIHSHLVNRMAPYSAHIEQILIHHLSMCLSSCDDQGQGGGVQEEGQVELHSGAQGVVGYKWEEVGPGGKVVLPQPQDSGPCWGEGLAE